MAVARGIGVVAAEFPGRGIVGDHGVHRPGGDRKKEARPPQGQERLLRAPVRLGDDADPEAVGLQPARQERHTEGRMVDVGVARNEDDVQLVPAPLQRFFFSYGEERHNFLQCVNLKYGSAEGNLVLSPFPRFRSSALLSVPLRRMVMRSRLGKQR